MCQWCRLSNTLCFAAAFCRLPPGVFHVLWRWRVPLGIFHTPWGASDRLVEVLLTCSVFGGFRGASSVYSPRPLPPCFLVRSETWEGGRSSTRAASSLSRPRSQCCHCHPLTGDLLGGRGYRAPMRFFFAPWRRGGGIARRTSRRWCRSSRCGSAHAWVVARRGPAWDPLAPPLAARAMAVGGRGAAPPTPSREEIWVTTRGVPRRLAGDVLRDGGTVYRSDGERPPGRPLATQEDKK